MKQSKSLSVGKAAYDVAQNITKNGTTVPPLGNASDPSSASTTSPNAAASSTTQTSSSNLPSVSQQKRDEGIAREREELRQLEREVMGENEEGRRSDLVERNLQQMIHVLHLKLRSLETAAKTRLELCEEDLKPGSTKTSSDYPRINDDFENDGFKATDPATSAGKGHLKENLVSTDGVHIDPLHLVIRTKQSTETAKKLELLIEEQFGSAKLRELKGKKVNALAFSREKSKKSEQLKVEARKQQRMVLEKELAASMEQFSTRSVLDADLNFKAPITATATTATINSLANSTRNGVSGGDMGGGHFQYAQTSDNTEGSAAAAAAAFGLGGVTDTETNINRPLSSSSASSPSSSSSKPDERTGTHPRRLPTLPVMPGSDIVWPISVKWCAKDARSRLPDNADGQMNPELLLLYAISRISLPAKENYFKWLVRQPAIQTYFVILFWLVKVKFFQHEADASDEAFLLKLLGVTYVKVLELVAERAHAEFEKDFTFKYLPFILCTAVHFGFYFLCPGSRHIYNKGFRKTVLMQVVLIMHGFQLCPITVKVTWAKLFPEDNHDGDDEEDQGESFPVQVAFANTKRVHDFAASLDAKLNEADKSLASQFGFSSSPPGSSPAHGGGTGAGTGSGGGARGRSGFGGILADSEDVNVNTNGAGTTRNLTSAGSDNFDILTIPSTRSSNEDALMKNPPSKLATIGKLPAVHPLTRTVLHHPPEKPKRGPGSLETFRQNKERVDTMEVSPMMQDYLGSTSTSGAKLAQKIDRTVPVSWCIAGGSDTHRKKVIPKELHDEISQKATKSVKELKSQSLVFHFKKMKESKKIDKVYTSLIHSGPTTLSRFSMDLVRRHRSSHRGGKDITSHVPVAEEEMDMAALARAGDGDDDLIALDEFLESIG